MEHIPKIYASNIRSPLPDCLFTVNWVGNTSVSIDHHWLDENGKVCFAERIYTKGDIIPIGDNRCSAWKVYKFICTVDNDGSHECVARLSNGCELKEGADLWLNDCKREIKLPAALYLKDYRNPAPNHFATIGKITANTVEVKCFGNGVWQEVNKVLGEGDIIPIGNNKCSNWEIKEINGSLFHISISNGAQCMEGTELWLYPPQDKDKEYYPTTNEAAQ